MQLHDRPTEVHGHILLAPSSNKGHDIFYTDLFGKRIKAEVKAISAYSKHRIITPLVTHGMSYIGYIWRGILHPQVMWLIDTFGKGMLVINNKGKIERQKMKNPRSHLLQVLRCCSGQQPKISIITLNHTLVW